MATKEFINIIFYLQSCAIVQCSMYNIDKVELKIKVYKIKYSLIVFK